MADPGAPLDLDTFRRAHRHAAALVKRTPVVSAASLSELCGGTLVLKAECLQRTGSFKLRGALEKLRRLGPDVAGVVAGSAGNHAQSLAYAARARGVPCEVFMPAGAAVSKLAAVEAFGATIHQGGDSVDECVARARARGGESGLAFVHPFDDPAVVAGQAGVGLELVEDVPDLRRVIVPVGGGGLASGVAMAVKSQRPDVEVVGVQARACAPFRESLRTGAAATAARSDTLADGIAIKRPGELTLPLIARWLDDVVTVDEDDIARAMVLLLERSKLVAEGAGAVGLAAVLSGAVAPAADGATAIVVSGGNVDAGILSAVAARQETRAGRRMRVFTRVSDRPGGLAALLRAVADAGGNVLDVEHVRDGVSLTVLQTGIELTVETLGAGHARRIVDRLAAAGYEVLQPPAA